MRVKTFILLLLAAVMPMGLFADANESCNLKQYRYKGEALAAGIKTKDHALIKCALAAEESLADNFYCETRSHCLKSDNIPLATVQFILELASAKQLSAESSGGNAFDYLFERLGTTDMRLEFVRIFADKKIRLSGKNEKANAELEDFCRMGFQRHYGQPGVAEAMPYVNYASPLKAGQKIKTREFGEVTVLRVCKSDIVAKKITGTYDPIVISKRDLSSTEYPTEKTPLSTTGHICLTFKVDGSLACKERAYNEMVCPGNRNWGGTGSCAFYKNKKVHDLDRKQWSDLIAVYAYDQENGNKADQPAGLTRTEQCTKACVFKRCTYDKRKDGNVEKFTAHERCVNFCKEACRQNPNMD